VLGRVVGVFAGAAVGVLAADVIDVVVGWENVQVSPTLAAAQGTASVGLTFRY
jgi:hypothetical protein